VLAVAGGSYGEKKRGSKRSGKKILLKRLRDRLRKLLDRVERELCGSGMTEPSVLGMSVLSFSSVSRGGIDIAIGPTTCGGQFGEALVDKFSKGIGRDVTLRIKRLSEDD